MKLNLAAVLSITVIIAILIYNPERSGDSDRDSNAARMLETGKPSTFDDSSNHRIRIRKISDRATRKIVQTPEEMARQEKIMFDSLYDSQDQLPLLTSEDDALSEILDLVEE